MVASYRKPIPVPDERTEGYWQAAREHRLAIQRCQYCGYYSHPPAIVCSNCNAFEPSFTFETVSGRGTIKAWVVMHDPMVEGFEEDVPWVNVLVELEEQKDLLILANLVDGRSANIKVGAPVEVVFQDVTPEVTLPQFRLVAS